MSKIIERSVVITESKQTVHISQPSGEKITIFKEERHTTKTSYFIELDNSNSTGYSLLNILNILRYISLVNDIINVFIVKLEFLCCFLLNY